jgi:ADP-ribose pyrophosphatase
MLVCSLAVVGTGSLFILAERYASNHALDSAETKPKYLGYQFWKINQTLAARTIIETPFARAQMHTVRLENGKIVNDWLWFDERDAINCLVRLKEKDGQEPKYLVFEQSKYGFEGTSLAPIGGFIEAGESPLDAAKRELLEETGLVSETWTELGEYRVAANRGAGVIYPFLATDAIPALQSRLLHADLEYQKAVELTQSEIIRALRIGRFQEVKWTATVALAILAT